MAAHVGVIGLGAMGTPIALALQDAGFEVTATSRSQQTRDHAAAAGVAHVVAGDSQVGEAAAEAAEHTGAIPAIVTSLPAGPQVREAVLGERGIRSTLGSRRLIVVDTSTCAPADAKDLAAELAAHGCGLVDAPVSGGPTAARAGTLSVMAGGAEQHVDEAEPILRALAGRLVHCGGSGAGQIAKACNQLVVVSTIATVAEALVLATKLGADPAAVREALLGGYAASRILELHGRRMLESDFIPGGSVNNQVKDIDIIRQLTGDTASLETFQAAAAIMEQLVAQGDGELDHSAAVKIIEQRLAANLTTSP